VNSQVDLFGDPIAEKRSGTQPKGYAAPPGTGPKGETCRTCFHYIVKKMGGTYRKCALMRPHWTNGPGSDIRASSPACRHWAEKEPLQL
jgi:hypothetical protein